MVAARQASAAQRQAEAAQLSLLNERYQKATEMLGNDVLAVRLGGIEALRSLKGGNPELYHLQVTRLLCEFAREPTRNTGTRPSLARVPEGMSVLRADVQAAVAAIGERSKEALRIESDAAKKDHPESDSADHMNRFMWGLLNLWGADLRGGFYSEKMNLSGARLLDADLTGSVFLEGVDLSDTSLANTNLSNTKLDKVEFSGAYLEETDLSESRLMTDFGIFSAYGSKSYAPAWNVNLSKATISGSKGLTQEQLENHFFWADPPPAGVNHCADTGKPLA